MIKYAHIGYPKNFSTSLQRDYFSKNKEVFHLGIGLKSNLQYYDEVVDKTFELYLKTSKSHFYQKKKNELKNHFKKLYDCANESNQFGAFGISSEHLSFSFTYDCIGADIKAQRLSEIMGADTKIIMIVRGQLDMIKSLFRESIRVGFNGNFKKYIYYLYKYQDRNYISDLYYDWVFAQYEKYFGKENLHVLFFEDYRKDGALSKNNSGQPILFEDLDKILNVSAMDTQLGHYNKSLTNAELLRKIQHNNEQPHDLGNHMYEVAEKHRLRNYLEQDLDLKEAERITYEDVLTKRKMINDAKSATSIEDEASMYDCDSSILDKLTEGFNESNINFKKLINSKSRM